MSFGSPPDFETLWRGLNEKALRRRNQVPPPAPKRPACSAALVVALLQHDMTIWELSKATTYHPSTVQYYLHRLNAQGEVVMADGGRFLGRNPKKARKLRLVA